MGTSRQRSHGLSWVPFAAASKTMFQVSVCNKADARKSADDVDVCQMWQLGHDVHLLEPMLCCPTVAATLNLTHIRVQKVSPDTLAQMLAQITSLGKHLS